MFLLEPELIVFLFGILAVVTSFTDLPERKGLWMKSIFVLALMTQAGAHALQYNFAINNQKQVEADTAMALGAFTHEKVDLLEKTSRDPFLIGYWLWTHNRKEEAIPKFSDAISQGKYVAASNYLMAVYFSHEGNGDLKGDFSEAYKYLRKAIANNPSYASAYYLLAMLNANARQIEDALDNLPKAVLPDRVGRVPCEEINREHRGGNDRWANIRARPEFKKLQETCRVIHGI